MSRPRVLLCEDDAALESILVQFLPDEQIDVSCCTSLEEIQAAQRDDPSAIVVSDCSSHGSRGRISAREYDEIVALRRVAPVIVTTARSWAAGASVLSLGKHVAVIPMPYDVDQLLDVDRVAFGLQGQDLLGRVGGPEEQGPLSRNLPVARGLAPLGSDARVRPSIEQHP
jgi:DNA-binding NtrC family response regulator